MGEVRTWTDRDVYIKVLKKEIEVLKSRYDPMQEGTGHYNTAVSVLTERVNELEVDLHWPFPE